MLTEQAGPVEALFTIKIYEPEQTGLWTGNLTNCCGEQLASVSAPRLEAVMAMIEAALQMEMPLDYDD